MDLIDFDIGDLYFDETMPAVVNELLLQASSSYSEGKAELPLLRAYLLAPDNLSVLVALYRFYFYRHRYDEALRIAELSMQAAACRLGFPDSWERLDESYLSRAASRSLGMVRFYLLALKAAAYIKLRMGECEVAQEMLLTVQNMDVNDRLGSDLLLAIIDRHQQQSAEQSYG